MASHPAPGHYGREFCRAENAGWFDKEDDMHKGDSSGAAAGVIWFIGWLFTISFAHLVWWKILLGIIVWPLFLGQELG